MNTTTKREINQRRTRRQTAQRYIQTMKLKKTQK